MLELNPFPNLRSHDYLDAKANFIIKAGFQL